jgi:hypothetical protein
MAGKMRKKILSTFSHLSTATVLLALGGCAGAPQEQDTASSESALSTPVQDTHHVGYDDAKGGFTCDLRLAGDFPLGQVPPVLEIDRMIMSRQPGMLHKHLPIAFSSDHFTNGQPDLLGGGRYLFKTAGQAASYHQFVANEFFLDGVEFLDRDYFLETECHDFKIVKAYTFTDLHSTHTVMRTERFSMTGRRAVQRLQEKWDAIFSEAGDRNMAALWVGYNEAEQVATIVYYNDRIVPHDPTTPDFATLGYFANAPALGHHLEDLGFTRTFDRTNWVLDIWLPFVNGDHGEPSIWPGSPPLPSPYCSDGVCEVSAGENATTCAVDCPVHCGDGRCQPSQAETVHNCPGDCGGTCN